MRRGLLILAVFVLMAVSGKDAHAKLFFGTQDTINHLQDINVKGPNGEALYLGFLTSRHSFLLPYSMSNGGYVLGIRGVSDKFYKTPKEKIEQMQRAGLLPNPLPVYRRTSSTPSSTMCCGRLCWSLRLHASSSRAGAAPTHTARPGRRERPDAPIRGWRLGASDVARAARMKRSEIRELPNATPPSHIPRS